MRHAAQTKDDAKLDLTPVIDISFLLIVFFLCLPFKTLDAKLQAFLPTDKGIVANPQPPDAEVRIQVGVLARGVEGARPARFLFRCGDSETSDPVEVAVYISRMKALAERVPGMRTVGELKADRRAPHKLVVAVLNLFAEQGVPEVQFFGTALPDEGVRGVTPLPYPR
ncbi:MAG: ExbD/TolR family protein [Planctomycetaceae bacterium]